MKTKHWVVMLLAILLLIPWLAMAAPVGKITNLAGNVDITSPGSAARDAKIDDPVIVGDFVRTKSKSKVEITFNEGNILRLAENTRVGITQYMSGEKRNSSILNLFRGRIQNIVKSIGISGGRYEVHTPTSVCGVRGTHFFNFYLAGASGSIFQEGSGYGYSINNPTDVKLITAGQGMFVPSATLGAQLRSVSNNQLDEMKNATEILGGSGGSGGSGDSGGAGSSGGTGDSGGLGGTGDSGGLGGTGDSGGLGVTGDSGGTGFYIPPTVTTATLDLTITPASAFTHKIDEGGTITGTSSDNAGTTFPLSVIGGTRSGSIENNPGAGLINGTIKTGGAVTSGVSGYMMGLPNASNTSADALLYTIYVDNNGQAGFLLGPLTATFTDTAFSGTGLVYKNPAVASTVLTPSTLASNIVVDTSTPLIGDIYLSTDKIYLGCITAGCKLYSQSEARRIAVNGGGVIGVWAGYGIGGSYKNSEVTVTSFTNKQVIHYDSAKTTVRYSTNYSGAVDTAAKEVSISGDFLDMSTRYKGTSTLNHFGYYSGLNYTSISSGTFQFLPMAFANVIENSLSDVGGGIIGSTDSLWTNTSVTTTMMGSNYTPCFGYCESLSSLGAYIVRSGLWQSQNYRTGSGYLTNDSGGAYNGYLNTQLLLSSPNTISTDALALYADTSGNIGILRGNIPGTFYPAAGGYKAEGALNRIEMATATGIAAGTFVGSGTTLGSFTLDTTGVLITGPSLTLSTLNSDWLGINSDSYNYWGIGKTVSSGDYSGDPRGNVVFSYYRKPSGGSTTGSESFVYTQIAASTAWNTTDGGYFQGNIAGAATDWVSATTSVFGGTVKGVFSPATSGTGTWSATALSTRIETAKFIEMADTATGRTKLADLNIPSVIVGSVNMSKTSGDPDWTSLNIKNMGFYASTSGGKPQIWVSGGPLGGVSGTAVSVSVPIGTITSLTGSSGSTSFSADFTMRKWDSGNNKWAADITGGQILPAINTATKFQGGAAGTISGSSITGTASGTAH
jgi:hypothetical protein